MPALDPAIAHTRSAVRDSLHARAHSRIVVALSGGPDSLALAAAVAFEAPKLGIAATAIIVDHALQPASEGVAAAAADQARALGIEAEVIVVAVDPAHADGPEAAAREARYAALEQAAGVRGATAILLGHTRDDQAETVLLGLARGAGAASLSGMAPVHGLRVRPFLDLGRETTHRACAAAGLVPWQDPHNTDQRFARVRVRERVLPVMEAEIGPGIAEALARTAAQLREDNEAFAEMIAETIEDLVEHAEAGIAASVPALAANPAALRNRIIRHIVASEFGVSLSRTHTLEVARLVTDWAGQGPIDLPGCTAARHGQRIVFTAAH